MSNQEIAVMGAGSGLSMVVNFEAVKERIDQLQDFVKYYMVKGEDYGTIAGKDKWTLLKPGAEKLCDVYGLAAGEARIDVTRDDTKTPIYLSYRISLPLISRADGRVIMVGVGSANSWEKKYRWRWVPERSVPPTLDKNNLMSETRESQYGTYVAYRIPNDEVDDIDNTLLKMAKKRALVDAVLSATRSSALFTQDMEEEPDNLGGSLIPNPSQNRTDNRNGHSRNEQQGRSQTGKQNQHQSGSSHSSQGNSTQSNNGQKKGSGGASDNQIKAINKIAEIQGMSEESLLQFIQTQTRKGSLEELTVKEASSVISALQKLQREKAAS